MFLSDGREMHHQQPLAQASCCTRLHERSSCALLVS